MEMTHYEFFSALLSNAGITKHVTAHSLEWARTHFPDVFTDKRLNEVIIVSGRITFEVSSINEIIDKEKWEDLYNLPSKEVHVYRMQKAVWYGIQDLLRQQKEQRELEPLAETGQNNVFVS